MRTLLTTTVLAILLTTPAMAQDIEVGTWNYISARDAVTQAPADYVMYVPTSKDYGFGVKCLRDGPTAAVAVSDIGARMALISGQDVAFISYRVGDQLTRQEARWTYRTTNDLAMSTTADGRRILRALKTASGTLGFRLYNADGQPVLTDEVPLAGASRAVNRLSCAP